VVRGGGAAFFAEQVPPPCSNGGPIVCSARPSFSETAANLGFRDY